MPIDKKNKFTHKKYSLIQFLNRYIKHATLEIELTLYSGEKLILKGHRTFDGKVIQYFVHKEAKSVLLQEVDKAEVFSI